MFEGLRKKLSAAIKGFAKKEEEELAAAPEAKENIELEQKPATAQVQSTRAIEPQKESPGVVAETHVREKPTPHHEAHKEDHNIKLSLTTKIKKVFSSSVTLSEHEIDSFIEDIRISLLQSDVSFEATEYFTEDLKKRLQSAKVESKDIQSALVGQVRFALLDTLHKGKSGVDIYESVAQRISKGTIPVKILFLGPNGTGKTTTMAKIAYALKKKGISSVLSASDTFRAAAIEQTEHHAKSVGVPVIKSSYGADPASIAFDAIAYAKAHGIQVVLIDTAGRQETNRNLINEMQKMARVSKPDITVFVGESTAGNQLTEQIREFNKHIPIDGIVLTKLDCDAKGGNAISMAYTVGIPILLIGTGESYDALVPYTPEFIVDAILPNS
jgi:fused signal recognition particle receptor